MTELREVVAMRGRRLGQGRVGSIGMRLGPRGVGSTRASQLRPTQACAGIGRTGRGRVGARQESVTRAGKRGPRSPGPGDGPMGQ
jgi:hypothetical protein